MYVYVVCNPEEKGPFVYSRYSFEYLPIYVAKGDNDRRFSAYRQFARSKKLVMLKHLEEKNLNINVICPIIKDDLNIDDAIDLENKLVDLIGKKKDGGPLTNDYKGTRHIIEKKNRVKLSQRFVGRLVGYTREAIRHHMKKGLISDETYLKNRNFSPDEIFRYIQTYHSFDSLDPRCLTQFLDGYPETKNWFLRQFGDQKV